MWDVGASLRASKLQFRGNKLHEPIQYMYASPAAHILKPWSSFLKTIWRETKALSCQLVKQLSSLCFNFSLWYCMIMSLKQRGIKFKPSIKLNHNIANIFSLLILAFSSSFLYFSSPFPRVVWSSGPLDARSLILWPFFRNCLRFLVVSKIQLDSITLHVLFLFHHCSGWRRSRGWNRWRRTWLKQLRQAARVLPPASLLKLRQVPLFAACPPFCSSWHWNCVSACEWGRQIVVETQRCGSPILKLYRFGSPKGYHFGIWHHFLVGNWP